MAISEGKKAPAFSLENSAGKKVKLADFAGKDVIVYFYPRDNTSGCTKEACGFRDLWDDLEEAGAVVLGVSPDNGESHDKFTKKFGLPFTLLSDPDKKMMKEYGAWGPKVLYGKKSLGVIRSTVWIGRDGKVKKHWKKVAKADEHPAAVLAALTAEG